MDYLIYKIYIILFNYTLLKLTILKFHAHHAGLRLVEDSNYRRDVHRTPLGNFHFRNQDCFQQNDTVKEKCDSMSYDLPNKEKAVGHVKLLPQ